MYPFLEQRRSIRGYLDRPVDEAVLARVARAAALAPSAHHSTPWHLTIITSPTVRLRLAERMAGAWGRDLAAQGVPEAERSRLTARSVARFGSCPALILASLDTQALAPDWRTSRQGRCEETMMIQSVAASVFAILLAAAAEGLGAAWHCPPLFCPDEVRECLGLNQHLAPQALVTVGYPAGAPGPRLARRVEDRVTWMRM